MRHRCIGAAAALGASESQRWAVALASTEAASNVIRHAYPHRDDGELMLEASIAGEGLIQVLIIDTGVGLAAAQPGSGLGQGLAIVQRLCTTLTITSTAAGTTLRMILPTNGGPPGETPPRLQLVPPPAVAP